MNIQTAGELYDSLANGPGMRYVLFTQGCSMGCPGCHNSHTWNKELGVSMSIDTIMEHIKSSPFIEGVTLSGGDPMEQPKEILELCKRIKSECPSLNIMIYSGRTYEQLVDMNNSDIHGILSIADYLADGRFEIDNREGAQLYTGSANQRIIDLKKKERIYF